jgi:hypothetical protein
MTVRKEGGQVRTESLIGFDITDGMGPRSGQQREGHVRCGSWFR